MLLCSLVRFAISHALITKRKFQSYVEVSVIFFIYTYQLKKNHSHFQPSILDLQSQSLKLSIS